MAKITVTLTFVFITVLSLNAANPDRRLATIKTAFVVPADELGDDTGVAVCLAERLKSLTPIEAVGSPDGADVIFRVSSHLPTTTTKYILGPMGGSPSAHLFVELPDGTKLWDDGVKYRRSMMRQGSFGSSSGDTGKSIECGLAEELANTLRDAMRKSRDAK